MNKCDFHDSIIQCVFIQLDAPGHQGLQGAVLALSDCVQGMCARSTQAQSGDERACSMHSAGLLHAAGVYNITL